MSEDGAGQPQDETIEDERPPLVLIIDDCDDNRDIHSQYLVQGGWSVVAAGDGEEGLAKATELNPDVIVLDLAMPGIDGWEVTRRLRADPVTRLIPVIALSAHANEQARRHALDAGAASFMAKPCFPEKLVAEVVRQRARSSRRRKNARAQDEAGQPK